MQPIESNPVYSCVDTRPSVSSFPLYTGKPYPGLIPYECPITSPNTNGLTLRVVIPPASARTLTFQDFSNEGLQISKSGCQWIRMQGNGNDPGQSGDPEADFEHNKGIRWFSRMVDYACVDIWRIMKNHILTKFGILSLDKAQPGEIKVMPKVLIQSGMADLKTNVTGGWAYERPFYLHKIYTKVYASEPPTPRQAVNAADISGVSSTSFFRLEANIKCFDFIWHQVDNVIIIKAYINLSELTWINAPAEVECDSKEDQEKKRAEKEKKANEAIYSFLKGKNSQANLKKIIKKTILDDPELSDDENREIPSTPPQKLTGGSRKRKNIGYSPDEDTSKEPGTKTGTQKKKDS